MISRRKSRLKRPVRLLAVIVAAGCAQSQPVAEVEPGTRPAQPFDLGAGRQPVGPSLFQRLGGLDAIRAVVDDFVGRLGADAEVVPLLRGVDVTELKRLLTEQICEATGGPCRYSGRTMRAAHEGLNITEAQWNRTVGYLTASLNRFNVPAREQQELIGAIAPMKNDIVGR